MKVYMVGGAVRDTLLGLPVHDRDWVVVGATPEQLLQAGYTPIGKDFPVFLHPQTHEEVALARTERKTAKGYHGFAFQTDTSVTLEEDLARRDLTINAIAQDAQGHLIDPYGGQQDLKNKVLRHVTSAFAEDPVRILRVARFAARYEGFKVAPQTMQLMQNMVSHGEVDVLVAERVWQEISKGLLEKQPSRMFEVLRKCGALARILPEVEALFTQSFFIRDQPLPNFNLGVHMLKTLDDAAQQGVALRVSFALLVHSIGGQSVVLALSDRLRVPVECRDLAVLANQELKTLLNAHQLCAQQVFEVLKRCDAIRQPERFRALLKVLCIEGNLYAAEYSNLVPFDMQMTQKLDDALQVALSTDTKIIALKAQQAGKKGAQIGAMIDQERLKAIEKLWSVKS